MLVDTHCHLDHPSLSERLCEVLASARQAGVERFVVPGVAPGGWNGIARLASVEQGIFPAYGLHPMLASRFSGSLLEELAGYARNAVAIGEIGLDYTDAGVSREEQIAAFRCQAHLAVQVGLPVLIHCRRAFQDLLRIMKEERLREVGGILHAFSGSPETARECMKQGFLISFGGTVTYRNAVKSPEVAALVPLDRLVLETDAPDMAPEPHRGEVNEPSFLVDIARKVAEIKGITVAEIAEATTANVVRLFGS
jgi:TatD DNase family protein